MRFIFRDTRGQLVEVSARKENAARHKAMVKLHGKHPDGKKYGGRGLTLVRKECE